MRLMQKLDIKLEQIIALNKIVGWAKAVRRAHLLNLVGTLPLCPPYTFKVSSTTTLCKPFGLSTLRFSFNAVSRAISWDTTTFANNC